MSKSFTVFDLKSLVAASVVATGIVIGGSELSPAHALTITGGGTGVSNFVQNEWVHLIYPTSANPTDPIAGVMILQSLSANSATFRIRIDNKLASTISQFNFNVGSGSGNISSALFSTDPIPPSADTDAFTGISLPTGGGGSRTVQVTTTNPNSLGSGLFDEFALTLTRNGIGSSGLSLSGLQFVTSSGTIAGTFSAVPTPALLPGLVAMGIGVLRRKRKEKEATLEGGMADS